MMHYVYPACFLSINAYNQMNGETGRKPASVVAAPLFLK